MIVCQTVAGKVSDSATDPLDSAELGIEDVGDGNEGTGAGADICVYGHGEGL